MKTFSTILLFSINTFLSVSVLAQDACNPSSFGNPDTVIQTYLEDCAESRGNNEQAKASEIQKHLAFWQQRANSFESLATSAASPAVSGTAFNLMQRAQAAVKDLEALINNNKVCDTARYKKVTWQMQGDAKLPRVEASKQCAVIAGNTIPSIGFSQALDACSGDQCASTWNALKPLLNEYNASFIYAHWMSKNTVQKVYEQVSQKYADWQRFSFESKAMLPWDMAFTEFVNPEKFTEKPNDGFISPPNTQFFLFHPGIGYEINDNEPEGERGSPALYVEVGFNRWRKNDGIDLGLARLSGASIIGVVSDTISSNELGYGVMLTFDNLYEVSVNKHSGDYSLMLGFNLYNLWEETYKAEVGAWKEKLNTEF